jgi:flagellar protein FliO/FliZ
VTARLDAAVRGPALAAAAVLGLALVAAAPAPLAGAASRATLAAAAIGGAAWLIRRRAHPAPPPLVVVGRVGLARETGLALVEVEGRRLLVGFGAGGTAVLARDGAAASTSGSTLGSTWTSTWTSAPISTRNPASPLSGRRALDRSAPMPDATSTVDPEGAR